MIRILNSTKRIVTTIVATATWIAAAAQPNIIYDNDGTELLLNTYWNGAPLTLAHLDSLTSLAAGSQVGTYSICSGSDFVCYPSRYCRYYGDDRGHIDHGGNTALYNNMRTCYDNLLRIEAEGGEFMRSSLQLARCHGMAAMIAYRMNDLHFADAETDCPVMWAEWWLKHPEYRIGDPSLGWHSAGAYDFAHRAVHNRKVSIIGEQLSRYRDDIDWYMLDFMRFFCYFKRGEGKRHTTEMTNMMRQIRRRVDRESARRKQPGRIKLAVRVAPSLAENLEKGIDLREWLNEGLIDLVSVGTHTLIDPAQPIARMRSELGEALNTPLYASTDMMTYTENEPVSEGMMRGFCSAALDQGADGIYLFNYFFNRYVSGHYQLERGGQVCRTAHPRMLHELGSRQMLEGRNKTYWISDGKRQYGLRPNTPLPLALKGGERRDVTIYVGDHMDSIRPREVIVFFRTRGEALLSLSLNGKPMTATRADYPVLYDRCRKLAEGEHQYAVTMPTDALRHGDNTITITAPAGSTSVTLKRVELTLNYGDVETHGYF